MMTHYKLISTWAVAVAIGLPSAAATGRDAITTGQIAAAICDAGLTISPKQVTLLADVVARTNSPVLRVQSMESMGSHRMKVRLDCEDIEECVPFYVAIDRNSESSAYASPLRPAQDRAPGNIPRVMTEFNTPVMRAGSTAILLLESDHLHIQLPVVCLENGAIGQTIRVTSKDHRQTYTAQVSDGGTLRGKL
jgi:hypothetical protein